MHIADMTMFYAPSSGGVRTYLEAKRRRLNHFPGVRHSLLVPGNGYHECDGVYTVPSPPLPFGNGYRFPLRRTRWRKAVERLRPDLIEAGDPYVTAWAALDAGRHLDVPVVAFYHSDLPLLVSNRVGSWLDNGIARYVKRLYGNFDRILAPSQVVADKLISLGLKQVYVQPLGVEIHTFNPALRDEQFKSRLGLSDDTRLLIFAGRGSHEKNIPDLLQTAKQLGKGYHLLLVGSNMPLQVPDNVTVINRFCPPAELARMMASSDALLHAGTQETFGLVVLEAMASGIPVVAVRAGALAENVPEECGLLCQPHSPEAMANAVHELFSGNAKASGSAARRHVEQHHDWDTVVASLVQHYRATLGAVEPMVSLQHG